MKLMKTLKKIAPILLVVGGINWGLVVFNWNLVKLLSFGVVWVEHTIYILVALSALVVAPEVAKKW